MDGQIVVWTGELETGIEEIDAQHRTLFDLLNRLQAAVADGSDSEVIGSILFEMSSFADRHFKAEQMYVEKAPDFRDHLMDHWEFSKKCIRLVMAFRKGEQVSLETVRFLLNWLRDHIMAKDVPTIRELRREGEA